jgi:hypothetical protein
MQFYCSKPKEIDMPQHGTERQFEVIVPRPGKTGLIYPKQGGKKCTALLTRLASRGLKPIARTTANGITEDMTVSEMQAIYNDWKG